MMQIERSKCGFTNLLLLSCKHLTKIKLEFSSIEGLEFLRETVAKLFFHGVITQLMVQKQLYQIQENRGISCGMEASLQLRILHFSLFCLKGSYGCLTGKQRMETRMFSCYLIEMVFRNRRNVIVQVECYSEIILLLITVYSFKRAF